LNFSLNIILKSLLINETSGKMNISMRFARGLALVVLVCLTACSGQRTPDSPSPAPVTAAITQAASAPTAVCAKLSPTISMTEGPYFKPDSPERASLFEAGMTGIKLVLSGFVLTTDCKPVAHALLDFWQANADGQYDNSGYTLRGHQFTDELGHYELITVIPGLYAGRTEHIHVKVQAPGGPLLTTQLFFPGVSENDTDGIFDPTLLMDIQDAGDGKTATFNFVVSAP
jgi:protocatechuate 3,4-dioxygenase beta subunit